VTLALEAPAPAAHAEPAGRNTTSGRTAIDGAVWIPLALLHPSPTNPRKHFDQAKLQELADSIQQHGLLQPILARPAPNARPGQPLYEIVCGERRWRASQLAQQPSVMTIVRDMDDQAVLEVQLVENLKRDDLTELEEADGYARLLRGPKALRGYANADELAAKIGKSRSYVMQRMKLLDLGEHGRAALAAGKINASVALLIARLRSADDQKRATHDIVHGWAGEPMSYKAAEEYIHRTFHLDLARAVFKIDDATLLPAAGACTQCPKRTGAAPDLFTDVKKGDNCTDAECFHAKEAAHRQRIKDDAAARGLQVLQGDAARKVAPKGYGPLKGHLELDKPHHGIDGTKPLRKLLGKADVPVLLLERPDTHQLVEVVPEAQALAALKAAGLIKGAAAQPSAQAARDDRLRQQREQQWRDAVAEDCLRAAESAPGADGSYRQGLVQRVALMLWNELHNDLRVRLVKLLGWPPLRGRWGDGPGITAEQHIGGLSDAELCRYLTAATIAGDLVTNNASGARKPEQLLATAQALGVDVEAVRARVRILTKTTTDKAAAARQRKAAAQGTPETALADAVRQAKAAKTRQGKSPAVRYRDPDTGHTWTGRGLQPRWLKDALANGRKLSDFDLGADFKPVKAPAPAAQLSAAAADPFRPME